MLWLLLACSSPPSETVAPPAPGGPVETRPVRQPGALPLPAELPFTALSRTTPTTLVDPGGKVLLVLEAVGVELVV